MKKIVRLTESDLARIVKRVINERQYLTEGVPDTTLVANSAIEVGARTICVGKDHIKAAVELSNTGANDAYLKNMPALNLGDPDMNYMFPVVSWNVTINGKPAVGQADGQNQFKIPKGKKGLLTFVIQTRVGTIESQYRNAVERANQMTSRAEREQEMQAAVANKKNRTAKIKKPKGELKLRYNGGLLAIPVNFGGLTMDSTIACDAPIELPKGF
jgi:hypothetical protein